MAGLAARAKSAFDPRAIQEETDRIDGKGGPMVTTNLPELINTALDLYYRRIGDVQQKVVTLFSAQ